MEKSLFPVKHVKHMKHSYIYLFNKDSLHTCIYNMYTHTFDSSQMISQTANFFLTELDQFWTSSGSRSFFINQNFFSTTIKDKTTFFSS
jgi:hypothetical protein